MVLARIFEWPNFSEGPEVFEEFIQQLNNARGYRLEDVTLREGGSSNDPNARNTKSSSRSV